MFRSNLQASQASNEPPRPPSHRTIDPLDADRHSGARPAYLAATARPPSLKANVVDLGVMIDTTKCGSTS